MKKVSLLLMMAFIATSIFAQSGVSTEAGRKTTFVKNGFWDNWFIGAGAGANIYLGKNNNDADLLNRPTLTGNFQLGTWHNPYVGFRGKATYGEIHTFHTNATQMLHQKSLTVGADVMWNVSNYLGKYNSNRFYSFIPYVGIGYARGWDYTYLGATVPGDKNQNSITANIGLINNFRLSNKLDLSLELSASTLKDDFDKYMAPEAPGDYSYDVLLNGSLNLVYKLGKSDFQQAELRDQNLIDDLNDQINKLRADNARLGQPKDCPKCPKVETPKCPEVKATGLGSKVVHFRLGSANIDTNQEIAIYDAAKYLQDNPNATVKVIGYADKKTGSSSINQKISEKRAKNVANSLINKYNINSNRVAVEWKGDSVQPYGENAWNRVAIVTSAE